MKPLPDSEVEVLLTGEARSRLSLARQILPVAWQMNRVPVLLPVVALAACASLDVDLRSARESWRGASYDEVVAAWGQPAQSARGSHTWRSEDRPPERGAVSPGAGAGGAIFGAGRAGAPARCDRALVFRDGRAVDENWTGDPEFCKRFTRRR